MIIIFIFINLFFISNLFQNFRLKLKIVATENFHCCCLQNFVSINGFLVFKMTFGIFPVNNLEYTSTKPVLSIMFLLLIKQELKKPISKLGKNVQKLKLNFRLFEGHINNH